MLPISSSIWKPGAQLVALFGGYETFRRHTLARESTSLGADLRVCSLVPVLVLSPTVWMRIRSASSWSCRHALTCCHGHRKVMTALPNSFITNCFSCFLHCYSTVEKTQIPYSLACYFEDGSSSSRGTVDTCTEQCLPLPIPYNKRCLPGNIFFKCSARCITYL